jgi:hypothetical protein
MYTPNANTRQAVCAMIYTNKGRATPQHCRRDTPTLLPQHCKTVSCRRAGVAQHSPPKVLLLLANPALVAGCQHDMT